MAAGRGCRREFFMIVFYLGAELGMSTDAHGGTRDGRRVRSELNSGHLSPDELFEEPAFGNK